MSNGPKKSPDNAAPKQKKKTSNIINISREQIEQEIDNLRELIIQHSVIYWDKYMLWRDEVAYNKRAQEIMNDIDWDYSSIDWELVRRNVVDTTNIHEYWLRVFTYEKSHVIQMCNFTNPHLNIKAKDEYFHIELNMGTEIFYVMNSPRYMRMKWNSFEEFDYKLANWKPTTAKKFYELYQETLILIWKTTHLLVDEKLAREIKTLIQ